MKLCLFYLALLFSLTASQAQETQSIVVNPVHENEGELRKGMYRYEQFLTGNAFYKNGSFVEAKFNYNYLTNEIIFIDPKGDTLTLELGESFSMIAIQKDTFVFSQKGFIRQITHFPTNNLFVRRTLKFTDSQKKGAYGGYSGTSSSTSINQINLGNGSQSLASDQNVIYSFEESYFVAGRFGQFYPASRKGIYDAFPKQQRQIREFLDQNEINFNKLDDIERLVAFARSLVK